MACVCGHSPKEHESGFFRACTECACLDFEEAEDDDEVYEPTQRRQLVSSDEARPARGQHKQPCSDCPFARTALAGWLGSDTPASWMKMAHGETRMECHTLIGAQCAGAAIYRANVCKKPRDPALLTLPADRVKVFAGPPEFLRHHTMSGPRQKAAKKEGDDR